MKLYRVTLFVVLTVISLTAFAQEDYAQQTTDFNETDPHIFEKQNIWGIGLQGGLLSGMGLGVRFHPAGRFGFQAVGGVLTLGDDMPYSIGAEGQFDFDARGLSRFYGYVGFGYYSPGADDDLETKDEDESKFDGPLRIGLGVAYEWPISAKMVFNLNAAFTYFTDGTILPLPQVSMFYYFN